MALGQPRVVLAARGPLCHVGSTTPGWTWAGMGPEWASPAAQPAGSSAIAEGLYRRWEPSPQAGVGKKHLGSTGCFLCRRRA